jgi:hypothetical protein
MFLSGIGYKIFTGFKQRICFTGAADSNPLIIIQGKNARNGIRASRGTLLRAFQGDMKSYVFFRIEI